MTDVTPERTRKDGEEILDQRQFEIAWKEQEGL